MGIARQGCAVTDPTNSAPRPRVALVEAGSPGLNIYSHVAMGRGVPLLATAVRDAGYDVRAYVEDITGRDTVDWGYIARADIIGFSAITCTLPRTAELVRTARQLNPSATLILGGPEPTCDPLRSASLEPDYIVHGEAEDSLVRLLDVLTGRAPGHPSDVPGVGWFDHGKFCVSNPAPQLDARRLDELPAVDYSLVQGMKPGTVAGVWRSRGCPLRCEFCEVHEIWPRHTRRSDRHSVAELLSAEEQGFHSVFLIDDNAAASKAAFKDFLRSVASGGFSRGLTVQLRAESVLDRLGRPDKELIRLLKRAASFTLVCVGIESADDENLESLGKRTDSSRTARALKALRRSGVLVHGMFIALPDDTKRIVRDNGRFARRYVTSLQYLFEVPLPGTKRTARHRDSESILFDDVADLSLYDGMHVVVQPSRMTALDMQRLVTREYERFYSARRIVAAAVRGAFLRFRRMTDAQRARIRELSFGGRIRAWARFHIEYKFAPVAFLATGRSRVRAFMKDIDYQAFLSRLDAAGGASRSVPARRSS